MCPRVQVHTGGCLAIASIRADCHAAGSLTFAGWGMEASAAPTKCYPKTLLQVTAYKLSAINLVLETDGMQAEILKPNPEAQNSNCSCYSWLRV